MRKILVSGLINIETTLQVEDFPVVYEPVRFPFFGIQSSVSGVGYNVAKALTVLGDDVRFLSLIGRDMAGRLVLDSLAADGIPAERVITALRQTPQSAILYDRTGRRAINTDLKDIQDVAYPADRFELGDRGVRVGRAVQYQLFAAVPGAFASTGNPDCDGCPHHRRPGRRVQPGFHGRSQHPVYER